MQKISKYHIRKKMPYELIMFLKKHKVLCKYINNFYTTNTNAHKSSVLYAFTLKRNHNYISAAFAWNATKEGYYYWNKIDNEWLISLK